MEAEASGAAISRLNAQTDAGLLSLSTSTPNDATYLNLLPWVPALAGMDWGQPLSSGIAGVGDNNGGNPTPTGLGDEAPAAAAVAAPTTAPEADIAADTQGAGLLAGFSPIDSAQIAAALSQFADRLDGLAAGATEWLADHHSLAPWLTIIATAVASAEVYRRRQRALDAAAV
jgi:hypothetical protein